MVDNIFCKLIIKEVIEIMTSLGYTVNDYYIGGSFALYLQGKAPSRLDLNNLKDVDIILKPGVSDTNIKDQVSHYYSDGADFIGTMKSKLLTLDFCQQTVGFTPVNYFDIVNLVPVNVIYMFKIKYAIAGNKKHWCDIIEYSTNYELHNAAKSNNTDQELPF